MAANTFTKVRATAHQLVYSFDDQAGPSTLAYATILADCVAGPLKTALTAAGAECDSNAKATAALLTGAPFTGAVTTSVTTNIQSRTQPTSFTAGKAPPVLTAVDSGAGNPDLVLTSDTASGTGLLFITHRWSPTV